MAQAAAQATPADVERRTILMLAHPAAGTSDGDVQSLQQALTTANLPASLTRIVLRRVSSNPAERDDTIRRLLDEFRPAVLWAGTTALARAAQLLAPAVPVVFDGAANPVAVCLVDSMTKPGRNATGYTSSLPEEAKMLEALSDAYPDVRHVAVLVDGHETQPQCRPDGEPANPPTCGLGMGPRAAHLAYLMPMPALREVARQRRIDLEFIEICGEADLASLRSRRRTSSSGFLVPVQQFFMERPAEVVAAVGQVPAVYGRAAFLRAGAILAVAPRGTPRKHQRSFELVARILGGDDPAELPVQIPNGFDLVVNLGGIKSPSLRPSLTTLRRADALLR